MSKAATLRVASFESLALLRLTPPRPCYLLAALRFVFNRTCATHHYLYPSRPVVNGKSCPFWVPVAVGSLFTGLTGGLVAP